MLSRLEELNIFTIHVLENLTYFLHRLDLRTNVIFKRFRRESFRQYVTDNLINALHIDPSKEVANIKIDLKLRPFKQIVSIKYIDIF